MKKSYKMEIQDDTYYKLIPKDPHWSYYLLWPFITTAKVVGNLVAITLGRILALAIFNPLATIKPEQDNQLHENNPKYPDPEHTSDFHIINVISKPGFFLRIFQNYARKLQSFFPELPYFIKRITQSILRINVINKSDCEQLIGRVVLAMNSPNSKITSEDIYIKGLEYIDSELRQETIDTINNAFRNQFNDETFDIRNNSKKLNFFSLETTGHAVLDSVEIIPNSERSKAPEDRHYVIVCMPRSNGYAAWLKQLRIQAEKSGVTYLAFNYRGVERSQGVVWTENDMVEDAISQAERLLNMNVPSNNIAFEGECLGGAVATLATAKMYDNGFNDVKLFNARSFRSTSRLILYKILPNNEASWFNPITYLRYASAALFCIVGVPIIKLGHWNLNAASAWDKIPEENKDFIVTRSKIDEHGRRNLDDPMVEHNHASVYSYVREKLFENSQPTAKELDNLHEHRFTVKPTVDGKHKVRNGHICGRSELVARGTVAHKPQWCDARGYTAGFFKRIWQQQTSPQELEQAAPQNNLCA